jgi:hypothetical protein
MPAADIRASRRKVNANVAGNHQLATKRTVQGPILDKRLAVAESQLAGTETPFMNSEPATIESRKPQQPMGAKGIIFAVVGAASGVFAAIKLASLLPVWFAVLLTFVLWFLLVACMTASCGSELLDILVGSVTIVIVMAVVVPAGIRMWQRKHQKSLPAAQSYIETPRAIQPTIALHSTPVAWSVCILGVIGPARVSAGRSANWSVSSRSKK